MNVGQNTECSMDCLKITTSETYLEGDFIGAKKLRHEIYNNSNLIVKIENVICKTKDSKLFSFFSLFKRLCFIGLTLVMENKTNKFVIGPKESITVNFFIKKFGMSSQIQNENRTLFELFFQFHLMLLLSFFSIFKKIFYRKKEEVFYCQCILLLKDALFREIKFISDEEEKKNALEKFSKDIGKYSFLIEDDSTQNLIISKMKKFRIRNFDNLNANDKECYFKIVNFVKEIKISTLLIIEAENIKEKTNLWCCFQLKDKEIAQEMLDFHRKYLEKNIWNLICPTTNYEAS